MKTISFYPLKYFTNKGSSSNSDDLSLSFYPKNDSVLNVFNCRRGGGKNWSISNESSYENTLGVKLNTTSPDSWDLNSRISFELIQYSKTITNASIIKTATITNGGISLTNHNENIPVYYLVYCDALNFNRESCLEELSLPLSSGSTYNLDVNNRFNCLRVDYLESINYRYNLKFRNSTEKESYLNSLDFAMFTANYPGCLMLTSASNNVISDSLSAQFKDTESFVEKFTIWILVSKLTEFPVNYDSVSANFGTWDSSVKKTSIINRMFRMPLRLTMPIINDNQKEMNWDYELICFEQTQNGFNATAWTRVQFPNDTDNARTYYEVHLASITVEIGVEAPKTYEEFVKRAKDLNMNRLRFCKDMNDKVYLDIPWPSWAK